MQGIEDIAIDNSIENFEENTGIKIDDIFAKAIDSIKTITDSEFAVLLTLPTTMNDPHIRSLERISINNIEDSLFDEKSKYEKILNKLESSGIIDKSQSAIVNNQINKKFNETSKELNYIKEKFINNDTGCYSIKSKDDLKSFLGSENKNFYEKLGSYIESQKNQKKEIKINVSPQEINDMYSAERTSELKEEIKKISNVNVNNANTYNNLSDIRKNAIDNADAKNKEKEKLHKEKIEKDMSKILLNPEERLMNIKMTFNKNSIAFTDKASPNQQRELLIDLWKKNGHSTKNIGLLVKEFQEFAKKFNGGKYPVITNEKLKEHDLNIINQSAKVTGNNQEQQISKNNFRR